MKSARRNFDERTRAMRRQRTWRVEEEEEEEEAASTSPRFQLRSRADPRPRVEKPGQGQGQGQCPFSCQHHVDRPKKRQKDARQVVVEAAAAAAVSVAGRKEGYLRQQARARWPDLGVGSLTTKQWITRAKQDPGKWSGHGVAQKCFSKYKLQHREARKHGPKENCSASNAELLPFHLIFARLPFRQLFQLRCVCKLWKLMLSGDALSLLPATTNTDQEEYWFVMSRPLPCKQRLWSFRAFSSLDGAFFRFPLPTFSPGKLSTLLGGMRSSLLPRRERLYRVGSHYPRLASAGGLMCAFVHKPDALDDYHVIVVNCLTGSVKVLPPLLNAHHLSTLPKSESVGCNMYMSIDDEDPSRYYIMVTQLEPAGLTPIPDTYFEIFDSRKGCWRVGHAMELATVDSKVSHGDFFFTSYQWYPVFTETLLAYRAADDLWSKVSVGRRSHGISGAPVYLKYKGRLRQCFALSSGSDWLGFGVSELQFVSSEAATWVEVARTPHHIWEGLPCKWIYNLMAEGSLFCMAFEDRKGHFQPPLVYDMAQNLWFSLPGSTDFGCISVCRPRLSLQVRYLEGEEYVEGEE